MAVPVITFDGSPGNCDGAPIGVSVALSEDGGFAGAHDVRWTVEGPTGSLAELATSSVIGAPPFTNAFVPDVPGDYLFRLVLTDFAGATSTATAVLSVSLPYELTGGIPAPGESTERGADRGWADGAGVILSRASDTRRGCEFVTFYNGSGGTLTQGMIVSLSTQRRWPDLTGGAVVPGAPLDYIAGTVGSTTPSMLVMVLGSVSSGQRGTALRRGMFPINPTAWGITAGAPRTIYYGGPNAIPTYKANPTVLGQALLLSPTADPAGWVFFCPQGAELRVQQGSGRLTLADNAGTTDLSTALRWTATELAGFSLRFGIYRGNTAATGRIVAACNPALPELQIVVQIQETTTGTGVGFLGAVAAGVAKLQYQTTSTGTAATMTYAIEEVWAR